MSATVKQRANVYTTMLVVSFLCMVIACLFLYFEMERYAMEYKVPDNLKASRAEDNAKNAPVPEAPAEPDPAPMDMNPDAPMPDPNAPMPDPNAPMPDPNAPMPDPNAPMPDPAAPADGAAMPAEPGAAAPPADPAAM